MSIYGSNTASRLSRFSAVYYTQLTFVSSSGNTGGCLCGNDDETLYTVLEMLPIQAELVHLCCADEQGPPRTISEPVTPSD